MKLTGKHQFAAPPQDVYARLLDPDLLRECMPGCERLDQVADGVFELTFVVPVPAIKGGFDGTVEILDQAPPTSFRMKIKANGKSGFVHADARMRIEPNGSSSVVHYNADAQVGGPAAAVGQRVLTGISRRQIEQMMMCLSVGRRRPGLLARIRKWLTAQFRRSGH